MQFSISFKTPDAVYYAVEEEVSHLQLTETELEDFEGYEDPTGACREAKMEELKEFVAKWVRYGEYVNIKFDTEKGTATVETVK